LNLVTGGTGIIGSHVVLRLLQEGKPVIAGMRNSSDLVKVKKLFDYYGCAHLYPKIIWKEIDICDRFSIESALDGVSTVYHCAGHVSFDKKDRGRLFKINEEGTSNLIAACVHKQVKAFCHVSSISAINNQDHKKPLHENVFWKKSGHESDYALSKYNAEREVWRAIEEGLPAVIVNPGVVLAPGFWNQSSSRLFDACSGGNLFYPEGSTGYIAARDTAALMIELTEKQHFANRYILIEDNYSFEEILNLVAEGMGKHGVKFKAGRWLLQTGRLLDYFASKVLRKERRLTKAVVNAALSKQIYLNSKIKQSIDFQFTPVKDEIKEICRYYLKERI
jgi:dihydroflavonol-4-reductase